MTGNNHLSSCPYFFSVLVMRMAHYKAKDSITQKQNVKELTLFDEFLWTL